MSFESERLSELKILFADAPPGIRDKIIDYSRLIEDKTENFVGRQFVFATIADFIGSNPRGYFIISCEPGVGKTAIAAQLVKMNGFVHHFNIQAEGIYKTESFLRNICSQLIAAYGLPYTDLPPEATHDSGFLYQLLSEISEELDPSERVVIVIDALDEADSLGLSPGANLLYLPAALPNGTYIIATQRAAPLGLVIECESALLNIRHDSPENIEDIREYLQQAISKPSFQPLFKSDIDKSSFVDLLLGKSEGNFLYLRYMLNDILNSGDLSAPHIPRGLNSYYEHHWRRIRGQDEEAWFAYKLPIVSVLAAIREPVSIDLINDFSEVKDKELVRKALVQWAPFLHEETIQKDTAPQKRYRIYHPSFQDFIARKEEIAAERIDLRAAHSRIAESLWKELFSDE